MPLKALFRLPPQAAAALMLLLTVVLLVPVLRPAASPKTAPPPGSSASPPGPRGTGGAGPRSLNQELHLHHERQSTLQNDEKPVPVPATPELLLDTDEAPNKGLGSTLEPEAAAREPEVRHLLPLPRSPVPWRPENCFAGGGGWHGRPAKEGGGFQKWASVPGPLFCVRTDVATKGAGTQILARKIFFHQKIFPHICVVKMISATWGSF